MRALLLAALLLAGAAAPATAADSEAIARGRYLAIVGDCAACHTVDPAQPMAGGYQVPTPFGTIVSPNITPDPETGIGTWTDDDFLRAVQQGIRKDGANLYPAFPYDSFTLLSREDVLALKAYLFSLPPVHQAAPANQLSFPFNQRWLLWGWKLVNFQEGRFQPEAGKSASWNRGAYLVEGLAHCGTCHTPRTLTLGQDSSRKFAGGAVGGWQAFNITPDKAGGIGGWSEDDLFAFLSTGIVRGKAWAAGPMAEAVQHSLSHLDPTDLRAMIVYLRDQKPVPTADRQQPRFALGSPARYETSLRGAQGLSDSTAAASGAELFSGNCASCHGTSGAGSADGYVPPLLHDTTVGALEPNNLIMVLLNGVARTAAGKTAFMPDFAGLSDDEIASLASFVLRQFGTPSVQVSARQVAGFRDPAGPHSDYGGIVLGTAAGVVVLLVAALLVRRRRRRVA